MSKCWICLGTCFKKWFVMVDGVASTENHYVCRKCGLNFGQRVLKTMGILDWDLELRKNRSESAYMEY